MYLCCGGWSPVYMHVVRLFYGQWSSEWTLCSAEQKTTNTVRRIVSNTRRQLHTHSPYIREWAPAQLHHMQGRATICRGGWFHPYLRRVYQATTMSACGVNAAQIPRWLGKRGAPPPPFDPQRHRPAHFTQMHKCIYVPTEQEPNRLAAVVHTIDEHTVNEWINNEKKKNEKKRRSNRFYFCQRENRLHLYKQLLFHLFSENASNNITSHTAMQWTRIGAALHSTHQFLSIASACIYS